MPGYVANVAPGRNTLTVYDGAPDRAVADVPTSLPANGNVTISAMNCRGLQSSSAKRRQLRPLISRSNQVPMSHIVCLSETVLSGHLRDAELPAALAQEYADDIAPQCRSVWTGHCGVIIGPALAAWSMVAQEALGGRAIVVALTEPATLNVSTVVAVYAPVDRADRRRWVCDLHRLLVGTARLIIMGDWNFVPDVTTPYDRMGGGGANGGSAEWAAMAAADELDLTEVLGGMTGAQRTFNDLTWRSNKNGARGGRTMRRLDWMAVTTALMSEVVDYTTTPPWFTKIGSADTPGTDHSTITAVCRLTALPPEKPDRTLSISWATAQTNTRTSNFLLDMEHLIRAVTAATSTASDETLVEAVDTLHADVYVLYEAHYKAVTIRQDQAARRAKQALSRLIARNPDPATWSAVCEEFLVAQDRVRQAVEREAATAQIGRERDDVYNPRGRNRSRPTQATESRTFTAQKVVIPTADEHTLDNIADCDLHDRLAAGPGWTTPVARPAADAMSLVDNPEVGVTLDGRGRVTGIEHMLLNTRLYYAHLYRKSCIHVGCQDEIFQSLPMSQRLRPDAVSALNAPVTMAEVVEAIRDQNTGRSPGPDGFCSELYQHCPQLWASLLHPFYLACFRLRRVSASMRGGLIALLFKGGGKDPQDLDHWRPVTKLLRLLCIIESVLKRRLSPHMATVTSPDQSSGAPGRDMLHTLTTILDAVDYAASPTSDVIADLQALHMILLDGRKAFDLADRQYMVRLISWWLGFDIGFQRPGAPADEDCCDFITWVRILIGDVGPPHRRQVIVNGRRTGFFDLFSGCPQGSVLSALLYNCGCIEGLSALLRRAELAGLQIRSPDGSVSTLTSRLFADDVTLFLRTRSRHTAMDCVDVFECASGGAANISKTCGMTLTPSVAPAPWDAAIYQGEQPTWRPEWDPAGPPRFRCVWLRPDEAAARALGVSTGPAANPKHDWEELNSKVFAQVEQWQRMRLSAYSMDERQHILSTYVLSNVWFTAYYRPPDEATVATLDAMQTKILWKSSLHNDDTRVDQFSPLRHFRVGHRLKRASLQMDHHHGGKRFFTVRLVTRAIAASCVLQVLYPHDANMPDHGDVMSWQATGLSSIRSALGTVAGAVCHPDIRAASRRRGRVSARWQQYLTGFAAIRAACTLEPPTLCEEVLSMPLYDNRELMTNGRALASSDWQVAIGLGILTVADIWDERGPGYHTAVTLRLTADRHERLLRAIPAAWTTVLRRGRTRLATGDWALAPLVPGHTGHTRHGTLVKVQGVVRDVATVLTYEVVSCGGWRALTVKNLPLRVLERATMEPGQRRVHGIGDLVTLHGRTATDYASCRARLSYRGHTVVTFSIRTGCNMLRGASSMTDEMAALRAAIPPPRDAVGLLTLRSATWAPRARDFAWSLRCGAMHCGRAAGLDTSQCGVCGLARDSILHFVRDCHYLCGLRAWTAQVRQVLGLPAVAFTDMAVHGCIGSALPADAVATGQVTLGAVLAAMAAARAYALRNHAPMGCAAIVEAARAQMRHHLSIDWVHASGSAPARPDTAGHHDARPPDYGAFHARWDALCRTRRGHPDLTFKPLIAAKLDRP
jgi:hypothetical protein